MGDHASVASKLISDAAGFGGKIRVALAGLLLGPALSGCILGTERPELNLEVPANYREGGRGAPDAAVPAVDWWRGFRSSELTSLMEAAQIYNLDIAVAIAQIVQADAQVGVAGAPLLPSLTGTGSRAEQRLHRLPRAARRTRSRNTVSALTASYMVDFWGKNRATLYAAEESATVSRYNREVVTLTTIVDRRQHLFPDPRRAGRIARRAPQPRRRRAHSCADQAAIRRRHRLATRPVATGGAGRDRARRDPAARGHAAAEYRRARRAGGARAGELHGQGRIDDANRDSARHAGPALGTALSEAGRPPGRSATRLLQLQRRSRRAPRSSRRSS